MKRALITEMDEAKRRRSSHITIQNGSHIQHQFEGWYAFGIFPVQKNAII